MNAAELRQKSREDLQKELLAERENLFKLRMQRGSGQMSRPHLMRNARRQIARIKTVLNAQAKGDK